MLHRCAVLMILTVPGGATAQQADTVRGVALSANAPVAGANVFMAETLEGAISDSAGRWSFITTYAGPAQLVVKAAGFAEARRRIVLPATEPITIVLGRGAHALPPTTVVASRYSASDERGATLTTLEVVSTPGTNADVVRAIQTLPGVQAVDEGTGLYVRGGDYTETHVLLNDAVLHTAFTFESPNGTFIGTVDPFLLDGIYFSSGGFGARHGNALSGIVALNTLGRPQRSSLTVGAGLAALSMSVATQVDDRLSVRAAANQMDTDLLFRVNGSTAKYATPPRGHDRSGSVIWNYRPTGELKVFGIAQHTDLASELEDPSYVGEYAMDVTSHLAVLNWRDVFGRWSPSVRISDGRMRRAQDYGAFRMITGQRFTGASVQMDWAARDRVTLRAGSEVERNWSTLDGSLPEFGYDKKLDARVTLFGSSTFGDRVAAFGEADLLVGARTRVIAGVRVDGSTLTHDATLDPRISSATTLAPGVVLTAAWGRYHQVPDPVFFDETIGDPTVPSMGATHAILGVQIGSQGQMLRLELWDKRYRELVQVTRDYDVARNGSGTSRGADLFFSGSGLPKLRWRVSLSGVSATRTDPNTGLMARAPFDVTTSATTVVNYSLTPGWHMGFTHRHATGRPFTPVESATFDSVSNVWVPAFGRPMSERLPSQRRIDLALTHLRRVRSVNAVLYSAVSNVLDRENVFAYRYLSDYSQRVPIRSLFNRSFYVGATIVSP